MTTYGRQVLLTTGADIQALAGDVADWKSGGVTIDWSTVAAVSSSPYTIPIQGTVVPVGQKFLRYGQVLTRITRVPTQTVTLGGGPTGGTFTLTGTRPDTGATGTTAAIAYNAAASAVTTALEAVFGSGNVSVAGSAGGPYTVTFIGALIGVTVAAMTYASSLTGDGDETITIAVTIGGGDYGKFGPYDPSATDGRQTLSRGQVFILNRTVLESGYVVGLPTGPTDHPGVFDGGRVYKDRIIMHASSASLANGPTVANFETALPRVTYALN